MGSGMPEIGSRISLISKADIRYEGKLFSVDPDECTIALSSVKSYGTEDRKTNYPVPAQNQVYDYILFRGTDIKDIRVLTTTIPNDPAIVQLSVPPSLSESKFQSRSGYSDQSLGPAGLTSVPGTSRDQSQTFQNSSFVTSSGNRNLTEAILKSQPAKNAVSEDESRSSTPSTHNIRNVDVSARVNTVSNKNEQNQSSQRRLESFNRDEGSNSGRHHQHASRQQQQYHTRYQTQNRYAQQQQRYPQQFQSQYREYNRDGQYRNYHDYRESYGNRQYPQSLRNNQRTENWNNQGQRRNNNNNNRLGQNSQQLNTSYLNQNRKPKNLLKFDDEYDFEQANTEFEQMRSQLEKTKLDDTVNVNGDVENKKDEASNEVSGEENDHENEDKPVFYDKVRSFFDQISYEAIERSKGINTRLDWKTERKINSETFGPLALRRNTNFHNRAGGNFSGYYNYQNRNPTQANNFRTSNNRFRPQNNPRKQYNNVVKCDAGKENRST